VSTDPFLAALDAQAGTPAPVAAPRAVRNNNPGNLRWDGKSQWQGMTGVDQDGFVKFDSPDNGQRALSINLGNQASLHGLNTVRGIISKYAPSTDGNNTGAYIDTVAKQLGVDPDAQIDPNDPRINTALQAVIKPVEQGGGMAAPTQVPSQAANDPYLTALDGAMKGGNAGGSNPVAGGGDNVGSGPVAAPNGSGDQNGSGGFGSTLKSIGSGLAGITPLTDSIVNGRNYFSSLRDDAAGFTSGALKVPETALNVVADLADYAPHGEKVAKALRDSADDMSKWGGNIASDPNSSAYGWGRLGGEVGATLPVTEIAPLAGAAKLAKAGKFASGLARYGDMALQGGAAGAALSGGHDMGKSALEGAVLAPAVGAAGDVILPPVVKAASAVSAKVKAIGDKLMSSAADDTAPAVEQTIRKGSDLPAGNIEVWHTGTPAPEAQTPVPAPPASATPDDMRAAMGSRGSNSGLEATADLPPNVAAHVDRLRLQGVPLDQALREAEVTHVGAKPTIAAVTRNPEDQAAVWEGAKQPTPEGRALSAQIAQNNAAVVGRVQGMVQDAGGVPAQGEAAETAAQSLAKASDAERARVKALYQTARDAEGDQTVSVDGLRELLATPQYKAPTDAASRELISGMNTLVKEMSATNGNRFTPDQVESLRQAANSAYDRMGGSVNDKVGAIKAALDESLDQLEKAGPAYKAARAAHRDWASAYENPKGISGLIQRDAQGNFINADNWRKAEGFVGSTADKPFIQVVNRLKANGDTNALNRMKASVLQRAYQRATNSQTDKLGNSMLNGKLFFAELNKIGTAKLQALFSPAELADIATTGRAAIHLNEAVPGSNNTSNTASALAKALANQGAKPSGKLHKAARVLGHAAGAMTGHWGGNVAVEVAHKGVDAVTEHGRARQLAEALKQSMSPVQARTAQASAAKRTAEALKTRTTARNISKRAAPIAAALKEGHR
jgi:hypothetical protein